MVGKNESWSTVSSLAAPEENEATLGHALSLLEERVKKAGVTVEMSTPPSISTDDLSLNPLISPQIARCPSLIDLAIHQAIYFGNLSGVSAENIAYEPEPNAMKCLVPGNVVILYCGGQVIKMEAKGPTICFDESISWTSDVPQDFVSARFLVVKGRLPNSIALWSPVVHRFLYLDRNGQFHASATKATRSDDVPRLEETMVTQDSGMGIETVGFFNAQSGKSLYYCHVKQVAGFDF